MSSVTRVRRVVNREAFQQAHASRKRVAINNVPKTALPADIRRLCIKSGVSENIAKVAIDYKRFIPTGTAIVTLTDSAFIRSAVSSLHGSIIAGHEVTATSIADDDSEEMLQPRARGVKGRVQAAERGVTTGDGPAGGTKSGGSNVVLYGLPGRMTPEAAWYYLSGFKLAGATARDKDIIKLPSASEKATLTSKFQVRLASSAEAHRLVRKLHETYYEPEIFDMRYRVRARVIY
ncbi:RNA recognition motif domain-containing protein [Phanerochaete sordida]|uniref:RNA recognition motif domain-containing protein n=1 Tax=Phanerochaete sordida TaxID=48140 RepID=A0A9P3G0V2_9APHY|nr:RNA recognition motif domain-containing protein [Phanerochaete sordida]